MSSLYLGCLKPDERQSLIGKLHAAQHGNCFICEQPIDLDVHKVDLSDTVFGGKQNNGFWKTVFETGRTPQGMPLLTAPLNVNDMIKECVEK